MNIGCFQQPVENFQLWRARGCNFVVGPELGNPEKLTTKEWCKAAADAGLMVVGNKFCIRDSFVPPNLLAWFLDDEPNSSNHNTPLATIKAQRDQFKHLKDAPIWLNLAGDQITNQHGKVTQQYVDYCSVADLVLSDWYVKNREFDRYPISFIGDCLEYLRLCGARSMGTTLECSWQKLNNASPKGRAPTPDELECEAMNAITHGAGVLIYFSTATGYGWPQNYDPTTYEVSDRMMELNSKLIRFSQGTVVPKIGDLMHNVSLQVDGKTVFSQEV
jgi:hypothetical protein